jgi:hypothetical protein
MSEQEFESPLKGRNWHELSLIERVQASMASGKDAERLQRQAQKATQDLTKSAEPDDKRQPSEIRLGELTFNLEYLMNHLGLKDKKPNVKEDVTNNYNAQLLAGSPTSRRTHNQTREGSKFKQASDSGEAGSLDYAIRGLLRKDESKSLRRATNLGKKKPGAQGAYAKEALRHVAKMRALRKEASTPAKVESVSLNADSAVVGHLLAGFLKSAGDVLPDFEKHPELLVNFLQGFTKAAGITDLNQVITEFLATV